MTLQSAATIALHEQLLPLSEGTCGMTFAARCAISSSNSRTWWSWHPQTYFSGVLIQQGIDLRSLTDIDRYDNFHLRRAVERDLPNFRWCRGCHCSYGEGHPEDSGPAIECSACGLVACSHRNLPWHHGESYSEYDLRMAARQARAEYKSEKAIRRVVQEVHQREWGL
jgi:hypothetical protein